MYTYAYIICITIHILKVFFLRGTRHDRSLINVKQRGFYHWVPSRESFKKKKPKEEIITVALIDNSINEDPQELQDSQWLLRRKLTFFGFFLMVYDRVGDGGKIFKGKFWLWKSWFSCYQSLKNWSKNIYLANGNAAM